MKFQSDLITRVLYAALFLLLCYQLFRAIYPSTFTAQFGVQATCAAFAFRFILFLRGALQGRIGTQFGFYGFEHFYTGVIIRSLGGPLKLAIVFMVTGLVILVVQMLCGPSLKQRQVEVAR